MKARRAPAPRRGLPAERGRSVTLLSRPVEVHQLDQVADRDLRFRRRLGPRLRRSSVGRSRRGAGTSRRRPVPEQPILRRLHLAGPGQPRRIAGRLQQLEAAPDDAGVVLAYCRCRRRRRAIGDTALRSGCQSVVWTKRGARGTVDPLRARAVDRRRREPGRRGPSPHHQAFHDVSTLSSSDGRGRRLRVSSSTGRARATTRRRRRRPADARGDVPRCRRRRAGSSGELLLRIEGALLPGSRLKRSATMRVRPLAASRLVLRPM